MDSTGTFVILVGTAGLLLIDDLKSKGGFNEVQFVALAVVGAVLLFVATFMPELAFAFSALFGLSVLLNSPTGIPIIGGKGASTTSVLAGNTTHKGATLA